MAGISVLYSGINGTLVKCHTTALNGKAFVLEIKPDWAPQGAQRFLELVESGFFTDVSDCIARVRFRLPGKGVIVC